MCSLRAPPWPWYVPAWCSSARCLPKADTAAELALRSFASSVSAHATPMLGAVLRHTACLAGNHNIPFFPTQVGGAA